MLKIKLLISFTCLLFHAVCFSQSSTSVSKKFWEHIYTPSLEFGYINLNSKSLSDAFLFKTSLEYRFPKTRNVFGRIGYETYTSKYHLPKVDNISNIENGSVNFTDVTLGLGYRINSNQMKYFILPQFGIDFYEFPIATQNNNSISLNMESRTAYLSKISTGLEYYLDDKKILKLELTYGQMLKKQDFWNDRSGSIAISIGYVTSFL